MGSNLYICRDSEYHVSKYEEKRSMRLSSANKHDDSTLKGDIKSRSYPERVSTDQTSGPRGHSDSSEIGNKDRERQRYTSISDMQFSVHLCLYILCLMLHRCLQGKKFWGKGPF